MWIFYEVLLVIGFLLYAPGALWRRRLPHRGWSMRLGRYPARVLQALQGRSSIWVHAVSVGEVLAAKPLLKALTDAFSQQALVLSTITPSGFDVAASQGHPHTAQAGTGVKERGVAIYFPL